MVKTRASNRLNGSSQEDVVRQPPSSPQTRRKAARPAARGSARKTRSTEVNARAPSSSVPRNPVATSSAPIHPHPTTLSSTAATSSRTRNPIEPTLASRRTRRRTHALPGAEAEPTQNDPSPASPVPLSQPSRKRKAANIEVVVPPPKRQRTTASGESQDRSLAKRLEAEQALRKRERDLKNGEAALEKKKKRFAERDAKNAKNLQLLQTQKAEVDTILKKLELEMKALIATNATLERKSRERNAEIASSPISSVSGVGTEWVLAQLEEQFQCSLCFEVMACPYQLNHGRCGHTFCALCLLKWSFAAVHRDCGYWHDPLECPLCRAELPTTPDMTPRQMHTFLFTPCRIGDTTIKMLLDILKDAADADANVQGACVGASSKVDERVVTWGQNGNARVEWEARDARGRAEMAMLVNNWVNLQGEDFIAFKDRLELQ